MVSVQKITGLKRAGASGPLRRLVAAGILSGVPTRSTTKLYVAREMLEIMGSGDTGDRRGAVPERAADGAPAPMRA